MQPWKLLRAACSGSTWSGLKSPELAAKARTSSGVTSRSNSALMPARSSSASWSSAAGYTRRLPRPQVIEDQLERDELVQVLGRDLDPKLLFDQGDEGNGRHRVPGPHRGHG